MKNQFSKTSCTTILVGKKASYDGSTIVARTEDSGDGTFEAKKFIVVSPKEQPKHYVSKISKVEIDLPDNPLRYTSVPNADLTEGIWGEAGINSENAAMSATETITTNERVLAADPMVTDGIGEEDFLTIVLPYIHSAKEGVKRLGSLLEQFGTYEQNGVAFSDADEIWFLETIGGHHWVAQRVPDDSYVTVPNQLGIQEINFDDSDNFIYSADLKDFIRDNHLNLSFDGKVNSRLTFGSHADIDHHYNTPRAWFMQRFLTPSVEQDPMSDTIPFSQKPFRKVTIEDIKYVLSGHYQDTVYDPYGTSGTEAEKHMFRPIGINRTSELSVLQIRPNQPKGNQAVQWIAFGSMPFNTLVPFYTNVEDTPSYLRDTTNRVSSENYYWINRIIAALADPHYRDVVAYFERYQQKTIALGHKNLLSADKLAAGKSGQELTATLEAANKKITDQIKKETEDLLDQVLFTVSNLMNNKFARSDN
ncbi:C69 family dipeptidase [Oenococcus oeni]|uniref:Dipeptidase n=2 Tax=Oenococcus oeni TaxID=1247 RepID=A0A6N3ZZE8_OENOE|nr:C69 family dipeptidase [Oenococcus oeni]OIK85399.1 dipeptidase [Oenococcus oeni]OIL07805.1 dipeptidase [Oenococcus oeni]OIL11429.1 dipeptidase [Oenococcus oeni]OIM20425.1 dipeptidase [Oenococcus oeni]SYW09351.1 putative dipeptidase A (pepDA) [Oenococcus oeni]